MSQHPSGPRGCCCAESAGRDALVRSGRGDTAARPGVVAFRLRRFRHAAHLVLLDRQRAAWLRQAVHCQRNDEVPGLRHAKQLVDAIRERLGEGPRPQVIINRFVQKMFSPGLRRSDIEQAIGDAFLACVPNDYGLVREAIDRGVPLRGSQEGQQDHPCNWKKLVLPQGAGKAAKETADGAKKFKLSWARS